MARNKQEDRLSALVRSTERDTWEKGQQAGRWLSQHMYSEKEKREMEKKRRAQQRKAQAQAAQPESAPVSVPAPTGESYFDANGIPVLDEPSDLEVHAVAYDMEDSTIQRTVPAQVSARLVVGDAEKEDYKKVALYVTVTCSDFAYNEEGGLDEDVAYNSGIYDLYTGRALPPRSTAGDAAYDYSATVEVDGTSYDISYSKNIQWMVLPLDSGEVYRRCNQNWVFEVPEAYDGLVYCAVDPLSYDPASYSEEIDESEHYAMDLLNDESFAADTTVFFRFGTDIPA